MMKKKRGREESGKKKRGKITGKRVAAASLAGALALGMPSAARGSIPPPEPRSRTSIIFHPGRPVPAGKLEEAAVKAVERKISTADEKLRPLLRHPEVFKREVEYIMLRNLHPEHTKGMKRIEGIRWRKLAKESIKNKGVITTEQLMEHYDFLIDKLKEKISHEVRVP